MNTDDLKKANEFQEEIKSLNFSKQRVLHVLEGKQFSAKINVELAILEHDKFDKFIVTEPLSALDGGVSESFRHKIAAVFDEEIAIIEKKILEI